MCDPVVHYVCLMEHACLFLLCGFYSNCEALSSCVLKSAIQKKSLFSILFCKSLKQLPVCLSMCLYLGVFCEFASNSGV